MIKNLLQETINIVTTRINMGTERMIMKFLESRATAQVRLQMLHIISVHSQCSGRYGR